MNVNETLNEYRGFALFNDVEDVELRNKNRGAVLANIIEDGMNGSKIRHAATADVIGYFSNIPEECRKETLTAMYAELSKRKINITDVSMH